MTNEDVIKVLEGLKYPFPEYYKDVEVNEAIDIAIKSLSRPKGHWIRRPQGHYVCSLCEKGMYKENFCPSCGGYIRKRF